SIQPWVPPLTSRLRMSVVILLRCSASGYVSIRPVLSGLSSFRPMPRARDVSRSTLVWSGRRTGDYAGGRSECRCRRRSAVASPCLDHYILAVPFTDLQRCPTPVGPAIQKAGLAEDIREGNDRRSSVY